MDDQQNELSTFRAELLEAKEALNRCRVFAAVADNEKRDRIIAEDTNIKLRAALDKYGEHTTTCSYTMYRSNCTCGLKDALA